MVCHDAWFFGMHMLFHKVRCTPLLLQQHKQNLLKVDFHLLN